MDCPICFETIECDKSDLNRAILDCGHEFHPKCILTWLKHKSNCPVCRNNHCSEQKTSTVILRVRQLPNIIIPNDYDNEE